jgi:hypothetical protein
VRAGFQACTGGCTIGTRNTGEFDHEHRLAVDKRR